MMRYTCRSKVDRVVVSTLLYCISCLRPYKCDGCIRLAFGHVGRLPGVVMPCTRSARISEDALNQAKLRCDRLRLPHGQFSCLKRQGAPTVSSMMYCTCLAVVMPLMHSLTLTPRVQMCQRQRQWCSRELGEDVPVITCLSHEKYTFCCPGDILIDDRWVKLGCTGQLRLSRSVILTVRFEVPYLLIPY